MPTFCAPLAHPDYGDHVLYSVVGRGEGNHSVRAWEFAGWQAESMSWKTGCYIHAGLSGGGPLRIKGPSAARFMQGLVINSFASFPVGTLKHAVMCTEDGLIAAHGVVERKAEDEFESFAGGPPAFHSVEMPDGVEIQRLDQYLFQIAGPRSIDVLEKATGESLRDVGFLSFRDTSINGIRTEIARIGMSGNLAYELHGPMSEGPAVYEAVFRAGQVFGIQRLGFNTYMVNHVEGGFPQGTWTFTGAPLLSQRNNGQVVPGAIVTGSVDPANIRARWRTPSEVRWGFMAKFDHDFIGRAAVEAEVANPRRTTVILRWNPEDVIDIFASHFRKDEEPFKMLDLPHAPRKWPMAHADHVVRDGREVGYSSGTIYSIYFREVISMGCIDRDVREIGNEVVVKWGDFEGKIKDVRAIVERFPYLTEGRNSDVNVATGAS
jgi:vanillate/3-O-methylgallate O-demethylase